MIGENAVGRGRFAPTAWRPQRARDVLRAVCVLAVGAWLGCGSPPPCGLELCDIRTPRCQSRIVDATACLRGVAPLPVPIRIKDRAAFIAEAEAAAAGGDAESFARLAAGYAVVGLADRGATLAGTGRSQAELVGAYYSLDDRSITIIDWGVPLDSSVAVAVLVHELAHAYQDRAFGIDRFRASLGNDLDRFLAARALTEGEATLLQDLTHLGLFGSSAGGIDWSRVFGHWQARARQWSQEAEMPVNLASLLFPYPFGTPLLLEAHRRGGFAEVEALYRRPPASSAQVLRLGGGGQPGGRAIFGGDDVPGPIVEELSRAEPVLPPRFERLMGDRMGAWVLWAMVDRLSGSPSQGRVLGEGLTADRLSIFHDTVIEGPLTCWRLRFASAELAERLRQVLVLPARHRIWVEGREVTFCAAGHEESLAFVGPEQPFGVAAAPAIPTARAPGGLGAPLGCALSHIPEVRGENPRLFRN